MDWRLEVNCEIETLMEWRLEVNSEIATWESKIHKSLTDRYSHPDSHASNVEQIWHVMYDDGDGEDFSAREMAGLLVGAESEDEDAGTGQLDDSSDNSSSDDSDHGDSEYDFVTWAEILHKKWGGC